MATYRSIPRTIEAFQWHGQPEAEWPLWAQDPRYLAKSGSALYAYTLNGPVRVNRGDWCILGDKEVYPCTDVEFHRRYELLTDTAPVTTETDFAQVPTDVAR